MHLNIKVYSTKKIKFEKMQEKDQSRFCFCIFHHKPFQKGVEGAEEASLLDQLIFKYPDILADRSVEDFISAIISLYTYITMAMKGKNLNFLSWSKSKVAIRTIKNESDGSILFFVLRVPEQYSSTSIIKTIDYLKNGLIFAMGPTKVNSITDIKEYLNQNGNKICSIFNSLSDFNTIPFSFNNIKNYEWHRSSVAAVLTEVQLMQAYPEIWGIVCNVDNFLLVSHADIDIVRYFDFVENSQKVTVYLTQEDRLKLIDYPRSNSKIPDLDFIEASLLKFQHEKVSFFLIVDPKISDEIYGKIESILNKVMPDISVVFPDEQKLNFPKNTLIYNRVLQMLRCSNKTSKEFQKNCVFVHDLFAQEPALKDIILNNSREFFVGFNILNFEHFSSAIDNSKLSLIEKFDESLKTSPELLKILQGINSLK